MHDRKGESFAGLESLDALTLRESEEQFRHLAENIPVIGCVWFLY